MTNATAYPCDRGIRNNVQARSWHNFVAGPNGTVCSFCGATPRG